MSEKKPNTNNESEVVYKGEQRSLGKPTPNRNQATPPKPKK